MMLIISLIIITLYIIYLPSIDYTREGKYILWYGRRNRKFKILN